MTRMKTELRQKQEGDATRKENGSIPRRRTMVRHHGGRADEIKKWRRGGRVFARPSRDGACAVHAVYIVFCQTCVISLEK